MTRQTIGARVGSCALQGDPHWELVQRIASSEQFAKSPRAREFLVYVCRSMLEERMDDINEQKIGERVFGRSESYNPSEDNIVRSQARILRQKLEAYFAAEGATEPLILRIPKGGYVPELVERTQQPPAARQANVPTIPTPKQRRIPSSIIAIAALSVTVVVLAWSLIRAKEASRQLTTDSPGRVLTAVWSQLFSDKLTTTFVVPDHTFGLIREASHQPLGLKDYLDRSTPERQGGDKQLNDLFAFPRFTDRRYTTFDSVTTGIRVQQLAEKFRSRLVVRFARDITLRDLSPGNVIFIGRPFSNPWEELFEIKLNFRCQVDPKLKQWVWVNAAPQPGEQAEYVPQRGPKRIDTYASVALISNLGAGNVLMISGSNSGSQDAAAGFATNEALLAKLASKIGFQRGNFPHFDALLRTTTIDGVGQEPTLVAYRVLDKK